MGLITTQILGFGQAKPDKKQEADPKPVSGFDYAGQPMKPGAFYNGRPEHMGPAELKELPLTERRLSPEFVPKTKKTLQKGVGMGGYKRSEESRMRQRAKMIAVWAKKRAMGQNTKEAGYATQSGDNS